MSSLAEITSFLLNISPMNRKMYFGRLNRASNKNLSDAQVVDGDFSRLKRSDVSAQVFFAWMLSQEEE